MSNIIKPFDASIRNNETLENALDRFNSEKGKDGMPAQFSFNGNKTTSDPSNVCHELDVYRRAMKAVDDSVDTANSSIKSTSELQEKKRELDKKRNVYSSGTKEYNEIAKRQTDIMINKSVSKKLFPISIPLILLTIASFFPPAFKVVPLAIDRGGYFLYFIVMLILHFLIASAIIVFSISLDESSAFEEKLKKDKAKEEGKDENKENSGNEQNKATSSTDTTDTDSLIGAVVMIGITGFIYYGCNLMFFGSSVFWYSMIPLGVFSVSAIIILGLKYAFKKAIRSKRDVFTNYQLKAKAMVNKAVEDYKKIYDSEYYVLTASIDTEKEKERVSTANIIAIRNALDAVGTLPDYYQNTNILNTVIGLAQRYNCATLNDALILYERDRASRLKAQYESYSQGANDLWSSADRYKKQNYTYDSLTEYNRNVKAGNLKSQYEAYCYEYERLQEELESLARAKGIDPNKL